MNDTAGAKDTIRLLKELVAIPSVNPGFMTAEDDPGIFGEERCAKRLAEFFSEAGCEVWFEEALPGRSNLMARLKSSGKYCLALQSHLDTVQTRGMVVEPFGHLRGGLLYGRGACDTKATTAVFAQVIKNAAASRDIGIDLMFVGTVDEEHGFAGSLALGNDRRFDACIVGEPTGLAAVVAHKGILRFDLVAEGRAAHSSTPEKGHNAIVEMMDLLNEFRGAFDEYTQTRQHPLTGQATWSPTMIRGGVGINTVPDLCRLFIERRTVPGEQSGEILNFVDRWLDGRLAAGHPWRRGEYLQHDPPMETDPASPVVRAMQKALVAEGLDAFPRGVPYGTDASKICLAGTPCVVFGPGSILQAHTVDEWIRLSEVEKALAVVSRTVRALDAMV